MPRPAIPKAQRAINAGISLPPTLRRRAIRYASSKNLSLSALTKMLLVEAMEHATALHPAGK